MRQLILVTLLFSLGCSKAQIKNDLVGEWAETYSKAGLVFDFKDNGKVTVVNLLTDSTKILDYKFDSSTGQLSFSDGLIFCEWGKVKDLNKTKFSVDEVQYTTRLFFTRIKDVRPKLNKEDIIENLKNSTWTLKGNKDSIRMDFYSNHKWDDTRQPYESISHYWKSWPSKSHEVWDIGTYNGKFFFIYSNHQETSLGQIKDFNENQLILTEPTYMVDNAVTLIKKREITNEQKEDIFKRLTSKRWFSNKTDTIYAEERIISGGQYKKLKLQDINSKAEFTFKSDYTYSIFIKGIEFQTGNWKISNDGEYVITDDYQNLHNWLQLRISDNGLSISRLQEVIVDDSTIKVYMLIFKLV